MTKPPKARTATPEEHLETLDGLAKVFEKVVTNGRRHPFTTNAATLTLCEERAAAIRWILRETAFPLQPEMADAAD